MIVEKGEMLLPIIRMRHRHLQTEESSSTSLWNDEKNTTNEEEQKTGNAREKKNVNESLWFIKAIVQYEINLEIIRSRIFYCS